ncbi:hypothetical protein Pmani_025280 [Petrolisthes manimaculis]|uniref:Ig-like domain-containing protein n=1 Tax=Petrolisthes manimaculis TaxID=1843537 RepID=A0AAE1P8A3_9EUCA|nr:hypothetical protein Pmani_025280 [Petrolisthes manimaculis]
MTLVAGGSGGGGSSGGGSRWRVVAVVGLFCLALGLTSARQQHHHRSRTHHEHVASEGGGGGEDDDEDCVMRTSWELRHVLPQVDLENYTVTDIKVNTGDVAYLPCRFPQLSTLHQVSWIRRRDWNILTTGVFTYTSDTRFNVLHTQTSDDWTLQLKRVDKKDNGTYECQFVNLFVSTPRAAILGPRELYVQEGDTITLICVIQQSKPPFVFWYQGESMVNYNSRINVETRVEGARTHSRLTIHDAMNTDSGNYSCIPPNVTPAHVLVFVSQTGGDTVAAVQRRGHSTSTASTASTILTTTSTFLFVYVRLVVVALYCVVCTHCLPFR